MKNPIPLIVGAVPAHGVLFLNNQNMAPVLMPDSVAFLGARNDWHGDGLYALPGLDVGEPAAVYRAQSRPDGVHLWMDNGPGSWTMTKGDFRECGFWPVVGAVQPFTREFRTFLQVRFAGGQP